MAGTAVHLAFESSSVFCFVLFFKFKMFVVRFCSQGKVLAVHLAFKKNSGHFLHLDSFFSSFVSSLLAFLPWSHYVFTISASL